MRLMLASLVVLGVSGLPVQAAEPTIVEHNQLMDHGDGHLMDMDGGMIMGQNKDKLPAGCDKVSEDVKIEVHAGRKYSKPFPGTIFGFDKHEWRVKPCTRLTVTFVNEDNVRHQWMMHGLPKYLYDKGMFHLEISGPAKVTGTLILPAEDKTYLVHCDIAQHMEKGMKGQLIVGKGSGTFPTIPGITDAAVTDDYGPDGMKPKPVNLNVPTTKPDATPPSSGKQSDASPANKSSSVTTQPAAPAGEPSSVFSGSLIIGLLIGFIGAPYLINQIKQRCEGMTAGDAAQCLFRLLGDLFNGLAQLVKWVVGRFSNKGKLPPN